MLWLLALPVLAQPFKVTPYRPTVSNPAELSALQHVEIEFGLQANQPWQSIERASSPFLLKYPFHKNVGLLIGGEAWINEHDLAQHHTGYGDTSVLLKYYFPLNNSLAFGFEGGVVLPSATEPLGQGRTNWLGNIIISQDIANLRIDANIGLIRQGYHDAEQHRYKYSWALAASHPLTERWGIAGEFSGFIGSEQETTTQWLTAFDYQVHRLLILDFGGIVGLNSATDDYGFFAGFSVLIAP